MFTMSDEDHGSQNVTNSNTGYRKTLHRYEMKRH